MVLSLRGPVVRRILVVVLAAAALLVLGVLGPPIASASGAQTTAVEAVSAERAAAAIPPSPQCSGKQGHGKIIYQTCIRFNCDATSCLVRSYMGLVNNATSSRTVDWGLQYEDDTTPLGYDGGGQVTIPAGEQRTVFSPSTHRVQCDGDGFAYAMGRVKYDSSGWSAWIYSPELEADC